MELILKVMVQKSRTRPSLISLLWGGYLTLSVQNILECTGHITGGHKKDATFVAEIFFDPMNELDPEKKLVDLHMFGGASLCRKAQKYMTA